VSVPSTRGLRICFLSQEFPPYTNWGGVGVQFDNLTQALTRYGHKVVVVSRAERGAPAHELNSSGVEVWRVGVPIRRKRFVGRTLDRIWHARAVAQKVRELDEEYGFDLIEAPEASLDADALARDSHFSPRLVICCHGSNQQGQSVGGPLSVLHRLDWRWSYRRERRVLERAQSVVAASQATMAVLLGQGVDAQRIDMVPLGIDTDRFRPATKAKDAGPVDVCFVGRLQQSKGIDFLWRVVESLSPEDGVRFHLKGSIHPGIRQDTIRRLEIHSTLVQYHPPGAAADMPAFYRAMDALLLPSRFENFGLTYAEAMSSGLLVLAGRHGGGPEVVRDGQTGFLVDPDGPVSSVVATLKALAEDRHAFDEIRVAARKEVVRRFSVEHFAQEKLRTYHALVRGRCFGGVREKDRS
jgi:glycosyltransferase involved in cell wall biosynthesis